MLHGKIETRTWDTKYRGPVLICAATKSYPLDDIIRISGRKNFDRIIDLMASTDKKHFQPGCAIAVGELVETRQMCYNDQEPSFVELFYSPLVCHIYENVRAIEPFPFKGARRWKNLDQDTINKIKYL